MIKIYSEFVLGDTVVRYLLDEQSGQIGLLYFPAAKLNDVVEHRRDLSAVRELALISKVMPISLCAWRVQPLVEFSLVGDVKASSLGQGQTLRRGSVSLNSRFTEQVLNTTETSTSIITESVHEEYRLLLRHYLRWNQGDEHFTVWSEVVNLGDHSVSLEYLTSFNAGHITPFDEGEAINRLHIHRLRSSWSSEARHTVQSIEELELERSWASHALKCERFGSTGTKPTMRWFPVMAVEDREAGVFWGAQLAWAGSWQMEIFRQDDFLGFSGGMADRELGHWVKELSPESSIKSPEAILTVCAGNFDECCQRLGTIHERPLDSLPAVEHDLPIIFNEWCTSWGNPSEKSIVTLAEACKALDIQYLVIDAGWYANEDGVWDCTQGDWIPSAKLFPNGMEQACRTVRKAGVIPGLWFEFEVAGSGSELWNRTDLLISRDGVPVQIAGRRFLDMRKDACHDYLEERVLDRIEQWGIGYIKVDYNETVGIGVDGAESLGEGLRQHVDGIYRFFHRMKERFPNLVIENCASGSQRAEVSMIGLTAMTSFSDAHETLSIPVIAANMLRVMPPRCNQVWAVLREEDSEQRLIYSLTATLLGRMCLSGDLLQLNGVQLATVWRAVIFYKDAARILKACTWRRYGPEVKSYNSPEGWQGIVFSGTDVDELLVVVHTFPGADSILRIPIQAGYCVDDSLGMSDIEFRLENEHLVVSGMQELSGCCVVLERRI